MPIIDVTAIAEVNFCAHVKNYVGDALHWEFDICHAEGDIGYIGAHVSSFGCSTWTVYDEALGALLRFPSMPIPSRASIISAKIYFTAWKNNSGTTYGRFTGEDVDNSTSVIDITDYATRRGTPVGGSSASLTPSVDWDSIPSWVNGATYTSPELKTIFQTIIDRPGWSFGNAIGVFFDDHDNRSPNVGVYQVRQYHMNSAFPSGSPTKPYLRISFGIVYPINPITRVTSLVHKYDRLQAINDLQIVMGEVTAGYGLPQPNYLSESASILKQQQMDEQAVIDAAKKVIPPKEPEIIPVVPVTPVSVPPAPIVTYNPPVTASVTPVQILPPSFPLSNIVPKIGGSLPTDPQSSFKPGTISGDFTRAIIKANPSLTGTIEASKAKQKGWWEFWR